MPSLHNQKTQSQKIRKGVAAIVIGLAIVVVGTSMVASSDHTTAMVGGWGLDIIGVLLGLSGFGTVVAALKSK